MSLKAGRDLSLEVRRLKKIVGIALTLVLFVVGTSYAARVASNLRWRDSKAHLDDTLTDGNLTDPINGDRAVVISSSDNTTTFYYYDSSALAWVETKINSSGLPLATNAETLAGTSTTTAVTPAGLEYRLGNAPLYQGVTSITTNYPSANISSYKAFSDHVDATLANRPLMWSYVKALTGGTYGDYGDHAGAGWNSNHSNMLLEAFSYTPTELVDINYSNINYSSGDSGFAAGSTQLYGDGIVRGIEHNSTLGSAQGEAVLDSGVTTGSTTLPYASSTHEVTFGTGRILIDTDVKTTAGTVLSISSATINGNGTTWGTDVVGQYFKMDTDDRTLVGKTAGTWYKILTRTSNTEISLEQYYAGGGTSGAYTISPGVEVTAVDTTAKTITVKANSVAWAAGHKCHFRIHPFSQLTPFVAVVNRTLPFTSAFDSAFLATQNTALGTEQVGSAFGVAEGKWDNGMYFGGGTTYFDCGINASGATFNTNKFAMLPYGKRIVWGSTLTSDDNGPGIVGGSGFLDMIGGNSTRIYVDITNSRVGIGTRTPVVGLLDIHGDVNMSGATQNLYMGGVATLYRNAGTGKLTIATNTDDIKFNPNGKVSIGSNDNATITSDGNFTSRGYPLHAIRGTPATGNIVKWNAGGYAEWAAP